MNCVLHKQLKFIYAEKTTKNLHNRPYGFDVNFKTIRTIVLIFVAFSENLNFKYIHSFQIAIIQLFIAFLNLP